MNPTISFLAQPGPAPARAASSAGFPSAPARGSGESFSHMLDHAGPQEPTQNTPQPQQDEGGPTRPEVRAERKAVENATPPRRRRKSDEDVAEQNLAGASATPVITPQPESKASEPCEAVTTPVAAVSTEVKAKPSVTVVASTQNAEPAALETQALPATNSAGQTAKDLLPETELTASAELLKLFTPTNVAPSVPNVAENLVPRDSKEPVAAPAMPTKAAVVTVKPTTSKTQPLDQVDFTATVQSARELSAMANVQIDSPPSPAEPGAAANQEILAESAAELGNSGPALTPETRRATRAAREFWGVAADKARGTTGAKPTEEMKMQLKMDEPAEQTEQTLPTPAAISVPPLPRLAVDPKRARNSESPSDSATIGRLIPAAARLDSSDASTDFSLRPAAPMERITEVISREVRMFKRGADDLVEVVLTPDAKTQISLRLQWRDGQMEAQARCDLGDYKSLNTQWPQLQAAMAHQGVRLSHLSERIQTGLTDFFSQSNFSQSQQGGQQRSDSSAAQLPLPEARPAKAATTAPIRRDSYSKRLLESWA